MRDYLIIFVVLGSLPIGLIRPYYGLLVYAWISYMSPHMLAWSFAQSFPVAKIAALSTIGGAIVTRSFDLRPLRERENISMLCFFAAFTVSTLFAVNPAEAWIRYQDAVKLIVMALLASSLLTTKARLRCFFLIIVFSIGFYGVKGGIFSLRTGGESMIWGPGTSMIAANNAIGLALNMCLPLFWYLAQQERGLLRYALYGSFFLTMPAIMFTYSRASALTLPIVLLAIMLRGKNRIALVAALLICAVLAVPLIPEKFWDRQLTVVDYESDGSAMSRIDNWNMCWDIALDHPLTGAGFMFFTRSLVERYAPEFLVTYGGRTWDTHNVYLGVLTAHGFPGLVAFVSMIGFSLLSCRRLRKMVRGREDLNWVVSYSYMIQTSFLAFLINGIFVNMEYFDIVYHLPAVVASMKVICSRALAETEIEESVFEPEMAAART